eukprot:3699789-Ditylum_brightwellii.AAC.1
MDILENAMPKSWQEEMWRQHFDFVAKGQAKFISFCKNLKSHSSRNQAQKEGATTTSSSTSNNRIPKKRRGRDKNATNLTSTMLAKRKVKKNRMLYGVCAHTINKCEALKRAQST